MTTVNFGTVRDEAGAPLPYDPVIERVFRENYESLAAEASAELHGAGHAHAVVSHAFLEAWRERDRFDSSASLEAFLHHAVHNGAVREKYRRAIVQNMQEHSPTRGAAPARVPVADEPKSVDEAWAEVNDALHVAAPAVSPEQRHALSRHGTAQHVAALAKRRVPWTTWAIGLLAAVGLFIAARLLGRTSAEVAADKALASSEARVLFSNPGQRALISLTDGSEATLGPDSRLVIPPGFGAKLRTIRLAGTASFRVASGRAIPFVVRAGTATVTAHGTKFDVSADSASGTVIVRAVEDSVQVVAADQSRDLAPGEAVKVTASGIAVPSTTEVATALGWTEGSLVVVDRPLRDVLPLLHRWYALNLEVADGALLDRRITMTAPLGTPRAAIEAVETAGNVTLVWKGERMILTDRGSAKGARLSKGGRRGR